MNKQLCKSILACILIFMLLSAGAQPVIKVMSYNIRLDVASDGENRWDARKDKVANLVNYYEPDFLGGQEVTHPQLEYLVNNLAGYSYIGVGRDDGKTKGEYSCIFFKADKFDVMQQSTFWLSPTPDSISKGWDAAIVRVCTYGLFKDKKTKQLFWVFNTHFDHVGRKARLESAKLIVKKIEELNTKNYPVILTGDFNSRPDDAPTQFLDTKLLNARTLSKLVHGPADTWNAFKFHEKLNGCIDYIFLKDHKNISVTKFITITDSYDLKYPSDHLPVMATIELKK